MNIIRGCGVMVAALGCLLQPLCGLLDEDRQAITEVIERQATTWNEQQGHGFADGYSADADFVNIFGMAFAGREEIERRHVAILQSFLKDSRFSIGAVKLRAVRDDLVVAQVHWQVDPFRGPVHTLEYPPRGRREGLFTHVFLKGDAGWQIVVSQNTLKPVARGRCHGLGE